MKYNTVVISSIFITSKKIFTFFNNLSLYFKIMYLTHTWKIQFSKGQNHPIIRDINKYIPGYAKINPSRTLRGAGNKEELIDPY